MCCFCFFRACAHAADSLAQKSMINKSEFWGRPQEYSNSLYLTISRSLPFSTYIHVEQWHHFINDRCFFDYLPVPKLDHLPVPKLEYLPVAKLDYLPVPKLDHPPITQYGFHPVTKLYYLRSKFRVDCPVEQSTLKLGPIAQWAIDPRCRIDPRFRIDCSIEQSTLWVQAARTHAHAPRHETISTVDSPPTSDIYIYIYIYIMGTMNCKSAR